MTAILPLLFTQQQPPSPIARVAVGVIVGNGLACLTDNPSGCSIIRIGPRRRDLVP